KAIQDSVSVGKVNHKFNTANGKLEIYDFPGEYAQRFDGVNKGGGDQAASLKGIYDDSGRTAEIRMQDEAMHGLVIHGTSECRQLTSGYKFSLQKHFNADGDYVLTSVQHTARNPSHISGGGGVFSYHNSFTCIPSKLPFRPARSTPKPFVQGTQTAEVVGPS